VRACMLSVYVRVECVRTCMLSLCECVSVRECVCMLSLCECVCERVHVRVECVCERVHVRVECVCVCASCSVCL